MTPGDTLIQRLREHAEDLLKPGGTNASDLVKALRDAADRLAALRQQQEQWQPIETAPKDGSEVLLTDGKWKRTGYWARRIERWSVDAVVPLSQPTHWMLLPDPPAAVIAEQSVSPLCGARKDGWTCNRPRGHSGDHQDWNNGGGCVGWLNVVLAEQAP